MPSSIDLIRADPTLRSRDDSGVTAIAVGTALWAVALVTFVLAGPALTGIDVARWTLICAIGTALGIPGLAIVLARRSRMRKRQAQS